MLETYYVKGPNGALFLCDYGSKSTDCIVFFPPFAEEMNKSRHIIHTQAMAMAAVGYRVIIPDLIGTGDSDCDFAVGRPSVWLEDIRFVVRLLKEQGFTRLTGWGLRGGCLLAAAFAQQTPSAFSQFLFWSPILDGKQLIAQFLRIRIAASMMSGERESVTSLRESIRNSEPAQAHIEVAGYTINPLLPDEYDKLLLSAECFTHDHSVIWLEVSNRDEPSLMPPSLKCSAVLRDHGLNVETFAVSGEAFWGTQELVAVPKLISQTCLSLGAAGVSQTLNSPHSTASQIASPKPINFVCQGEPLLGLIHAPIKTDSIIDTGVLIVVGGPQYRVGSHRQFLLLSRDLSQAGIATMRFDYRGMGDSGGALRGFESVDDDIHAAINAFMADRPHLKHVVIWGLCDAATAAAFYAYQDERVQGLVLLNPWVRSERGEADAFLKHYYLSRLMSVSFWKKLFTGGVNFGESCQSLLRIVRTRFQREETPIDLPPTEGGGRSKLSFPPSAGLAEKMCLSLNEFDGRVQVILSENDLTAAEFQSAVKADSGFSCWMASDKVSVTFLENADHTFSTREWRDQVAKITLNWLQIFR